MANKHGRDESLRFFYQKVHFPNGYPNSAHTYEVHHIIPFSEKNHGVKRSYVDNLLNLIGIEENLHKELSKSAQKRKRYYRIHFTDDGNKVKFSETRDSTDFLDFNGQTEFLNGGLVSYNPVYAPFIQTYNHFFIDDYNANQLKRKS